LAEALRALRYMPVNGYPAGFTNSWPAIQHEYSDRSAYEDDPMWKAERAADSNWAKPRPSSIEIARRWRCSNGPTIASLPRAVIEYMAAFDLAAVWRRPG
jgi:hypothetical protein